jgi:nucleotide-binding universal stress UspA family protein
VHAPWDHTSEPWRLYLKHIVDLNQQRLREVQDYLNEIVRRVRRKDAVNIVTVLSESEHTVDQLCAAASGVDLIIMATRGWGRWRRLWQGSTSAKLIRRASCPLLLVRGYPSPVDLTGDPVVRKVLVPLDGSTVAEQILEPAAAISQVSDANVTLLHVENSGPISSNFKSGDVLGYLTQTARSWNSRLAAVSTQVLETEESTAQAVLSFATHHEIDLVAVTTRARGGLAGLTRDRIADVILQRDGIRVLVLRANEIHKEGVLI